MHNCSPDTKGTHLSISLSLPTKSQMFLSNKQREAKLVDVRAGDLPWGGKHFPVPSSPFRWLGSTGRKRCTPRCAQTVCKHKNTECSVCTASKSKAAASSPPPSLSPTSCATFSFLSPDVVTPTQNHAPFAVAGGANVPQLGLAARALEAASVPVAFHGEEEEAIGDLSPTSCTRPGGRLYAWCLAVYHAALRGSWTNRTEVWQLRQVFVTFIRQK